MTTAVVVKERKDTFKFVSQFIPPSVQLKTSKAYNFIAPWIGRVFGAFIVFLVSVDALANNWAINDFVGNALQFRTPVSHIASAMDLTNAYVFGVDRGLANLSHIGQWMVAQSIVDLAVDSSTVYILTAGSYPILGPTMNYCGGLNGKYAVSDLSMPIKLAVVDDSVTFLRGDALSHAFTKDLTDNLPPASAKMADVRALGFEPARIQVDMRLTMGIHVKNTSTLQKFAVPWYRVYSKSYCTGCTPLTELGSGICNVTVAYDQATNTAVVSRSFSVPGSNHLLGLMFNRSIYSSIGAVLKYIAIFVAMAGFLASRKTIQWHERMPEKVETVTQKLVDVLFPKYFPHLSHAMRFDLFCYNSDLFVLLFVASNILDMNEALYYIREVNVYNAVSPQTGMTIQLLALSTRLLWLNVGLVKLAKLAVHLVSAVAYSGQSRVMKYLNFSSVTMMYVSVILVLFVPDYIEYNNKSRWDVAGSVEDLNGCSVNYFKSFYFRGAPAITIGLILNVVWVLLFDHVVLFKFWHYLVKNSLGRQVVFNTTCVTCDFVSDFKVEADGGAVIQCKARRLSTLQWYFMSQTLCFGLPEKELSKKKHGGGTHPSTAAATQNDDAVQRNVFHVVNQSDSGHVHLLDDQLVDVKSLPFNIKILRDTAVQIR